PSGANFMLVTGSRTPIGVIVTLPITCSGFLNTPSGAEPFGIGARLISLAVTFSPSGISRLATTTLPRSLVYALTLDRYLVTNITPSIPQRTAPVRATIRRLFRTVNLHSDRAPLGAKNKERNHAACTNGDGVWHRVRAIRRHLEPRYFVSW